MSSPNTSDETAQVSPTENSIHGQEDNDGANSTDQPEKVSIFQYHEKYIVSKKIRKPWYLDLSILISAAAFISSLSTSLVNAYASHRQTQIQELNLKRDAIQQLVEQYYSTNVGNNANQFTFVKDLPSVTNCTQLTEPYKSMCDRSALFSDNNTGNVYAFDIMLGSKASLLAKEIDSDISATELGQVAQLQLAANHFDMAINMLTEAKALATNSIDYVLAVRTLGIAQATVGLTKDANASFNEAIAGFKKFDNLVFEDEINYENAQTYLQLVY